MKWLTLAYSTALYNKDRDLITFQMETKGKQNLTKKQFTRILMLKSHGSFETLAFDQVLAMLNEMGYNPPITLISAFRKFNLPSMWCFLFGVFIRCLTGRNYGLYREKLQLHSYIII